MEDIPSRPTDRVHGQPRQDSTMSMIAMAQPTPHSAFKREFAWDESRHNDYASSRRPNDHERIALPSIRQVLFLGGLSVRKPLLTHSQAIPELQLRVVTQDAGRKTHSTTASPVGYGPSALPTPNYIHSPNHSKRRRLSTGEEREDRASQVPRLYHSSSPRREREFQLPSSRGMSPKLPLRSATESWTSPSRTSPFLSHTSSFTSMRESAPPMETTERMGPRPMLPRLPSMDFDRGSATIPRIRGRSDDNYDSLKHSPMGRPLESAGPSHSHFRSGSSMFSYHHPSRVQSLSLGSVQMYDRTPFSPSSYGPSYPEHIRYSEMGGMGHGDNKQRKRRGNLPKETTDKLRAWFMAHLQHPYPTEDEKQKLMQQTGLQMNQISNWFINARRRQLPTMINNARAESDAMSSARGVDGKALSATDRNVDYDLGSKRDSIPLSDGESSPFDDDIEVMKRRHAVSMSRGSV
ncbi:hypothetical protein QBC34DRAFT_111523 [Podospora aff. communis PSN243]|uniref:Homeobox domain-containing protein n=1 Tax=Podospora aff. communis PSN243 TaxID=3040156 RepID=A0AAV9GKW7_9PEZI|nr:hypothetical protein QBC34DRAFT_111523 [Podospora aff. communis PSN243]